MELPAGLRNDGAQERLGLMPINHHYVSAKADSSDSSLVRPTAWDEPHDMTVTQPAVYGAIAAGPAGELPIVTIPTGDSGEVMSKDAITKAISDAIAAFTGGGGIAVTGDICASMLSAKTGWLLLNGQTVGNVGSTATFANASAHALFLLFHDGIGGEAWPFTPPRSADAEADWTALKTFALPDARGRTLVNPDNGASVSSVFLLGQPYGEATHTLLPAEMPSHTHGTGSQERSANSGLGGVGGGGSMWDTGSALVTDPSGGDQPHNNLQPSLGANMFIKL